MDAELKKELYFLIAKFLGTDFPDICHTFIEQCEAQKKFPGAIFSENPSFSTLCESVVPGLPTDQLLRLVKMACPRSENTSILFNTERKKRTPVDQGDNTLHQLQANSSVFSGFIESFRIWGHTDNIWCLAMDATSQIIISGSDDYRVKVWHLGDQITLLDSLSGYENYISDIQVHPFNTMFAVSSHDCTITIYDMTMGSQTCKLRFSSSVPHSEEIPNSVHTIRFSPDGQIMAAALEEGSVRLFKVPEFTEVFAFAMPTKRSADWMSFSGSGVFLAITAEPSDVIILEVNGDEYICLEGHTELPDFVSFGKIDCRKLITCSYQETHVKLWSCGEKCWDMHVNLNLTHNVNGAAKKVKVVRTSFNCNDSLVVAISNRCIFAWSTATHELVSVCAHEIFTDHCSALAVHPFFPEVVFVGCQNGQSAVWDILRNEVIVAFPIDETSACPMCEAIWSPDGESIIASNEKGRLMVFRRSYGSVTVRELFMRKELDETSLDDTIVDGQNEPYLPQPEKIYFTDIDTKIRPKGISQTAQQNDDEVLIGMWRQMEKKKAVAFSDDNEDEEEEEEETGDDLLFFGYSPFGMSTRNTRRCNYSDTATDISGFEYSSSDSDSDEVVASVRRRSTSESPTQRKSKSKRSSTEESPSRSKKKSAPPRTDEIVISRTGRVIKSRSMFSSSDDEPPARKKPPKSSRRCVTPPKPRRSRAVEYSDEEDSVVSLRNLRSAVVETPRRRSLRGAERSTSSDDETPRRRSTRNPSPEPEPVLSSSGRVIKRRNNSPDKEPAPKKKPNTKKPVKRAPSPEPEPVLSSSGRVIKRRSNSPDKEPAPKKKPNAKKPAKRNPSPEPEPVLSSSGRVIKKRGSSPEPPRGKRQSTQKSNRKKPESEEPIERISNSGRVIKKRVFD